MKNKILVLILLFVIITPQVALASWWNPLSWGWVERIFSSKIEIHQVEDSASIGSVDNIATTTDSESEIEELKEQPVSPKPVVKKTTSETSTSEQSISPTTQTTSTTTSENEDTELELLKQQNEILKGQLEAQEQIAQNTTPVDGSCSTTLNICTVGTFSDITDTSTHYRWSCKGGNGGLDISCTLPVPPFEFTPIIEVGGATGYGFLHPDFKSSCGGCDVTDIGWVYLTIPEEHSSGTFKTWYEYNGAIEAHNTNFGNEKIILKIGGIPANTVINWEVTAKKEGYVATTKTGQFTSRPPRLFMVEESGGYMVMNYGQITYSSSSMKIRVKIDILSPTRLLYHDRVSDSLIEKDVSNLKEGDIITLDNVGLKITTKDFDGNWVDAKTMFEIIDVTATDDGHPVEIYY